jgi:hypothetical protein
MIDKSIHYLCKSVHPVIQKALILILHYAALLKQLLQVTSDGKMIKHFNIYRET